MGAKFHASKVSPEQVNLFRRIESEKVNKLLDNYVHQCFKMKVQCEKLVLENEDIADGLVELIASHGVIKLVISAAGDKKYSRKMDKPKSRLATKIMQKADRSCKIWFVCKGRLICIRDCQADIAVAATPLLPNFDHHGLHLSPHQEKVHETATDEVESQLGFYDELKETCIAAENLMNRALNEFSRREEANKELVSALQKAKKYQELLEEEERKCKGLEGALARANQEIARLMQSKYPFNNKQNTTTDKLQEEMAEKMILEQCMVNINTNGGVAGHLIEPHNSGAREFHVPLNQSKLTTFSPSSVIHSPFDEDCIPSYFFCPILQAGGHETPVHCSRWVHLRSHCYKTLARRRM